MIRVLSQDYFKENPHSLTRQTYKYTVLNVENLQHYEDRERFHHGIETLSYCHGAVWANQMYEKMEKKNKINTDILFKAVQSIMNDAPFSDDELQTYYEAVRDVEEFGSVLVKFYEFEYFMPYETEFILLGVPLEKQLGISREKKDLILIEYSELYAEMYSNKLDVAKFINEAKRIAGRMINKI